MKKALLLLIAAMVYLGFLETGKQIATAQLTRVQYLYTSAGAQAAAISAQTR